MNKTIIPFMLLAVCVAVSAMSVMAWPGAKSMGKTVTRTVSVGNFDELSASVADVDVTIGSSTGRVLVTAPEYIMQDVLVRTRSGKLEIEIKDTRSNRGLDGKVKVAVTVPYLKEIEASVGSEVKVNAPMAVSGKCSYEVSTGASLTLQGLSTPGKCDLESNTGAELTAKSIKASELDCEATTGASLRIGAVDVSKLECTAETGGSMSLDSGRAVKAEYEAETAGTINASGVRADTGKAEAATGGDIRCKISKATVAGTLGGSVKNN